jgi:hypothetical protein
MNLGQKRVRFKSNWENEGISPQRRRGRGGKTELNQPRISSTARIIQKPLSYFVSVPSAQSAVQNFPLRPLRLCGEESFIDNY